MADSDVRIQRFTDFLARSGVKTTRQRDRIVRAFLAAGRQVSAEELYQRLQTEDRGIGLVTVYRTLKLLREAGLATGRQFVIGVTIGVISSLGTLLFLYFARSKL